MTEKNVAQPALTDDELKASSPFQWLSRRYTPEVAERMLREYERIVLSKLRASETALPAAFPAHPLSVFNAGEWTWNGTGQTFSHTDMDEAAFSVYRDALAGSAEPAENYYGHTAAPMDTSPGRSALNTNGAVPAPQAVASRPVATVMSCGQSDESGRYFLDAICPEGDCNIRAGDLLYSGPPHAVSEAVRDVLLERARQINGEGFGVARDDAYVSGELAQAAACYAASSHSRDISFMSHLWPWASEWWKPGTTREDLLKSGALILAEIERIDRARAAQSTQQRKEG